MGHVYFLKHRDVRAVKIGMTTQNNVMKRVNSYNTSSPFGIEFIGSIETDTPLELEKEIHNEYFDYRLNGEWFDISVDKAKNMIKRHHNNTSEQERIHMDISFDFDWTQYYLNELKVLKCLDMFLPKEKGVFDYDKICKFIRKNSNVPESDLTYQNMLNSFDEYYLLMNDKPMKITLGTY